MAITSTISWGQPEPTAPTGPYLGYSLIGTTGNDYLQGDRHDNQIHGKEGNDTIRGGFGEDRVIGNEGDDVISGDKGNDQLWGSAGNDVFVFGKDSGFDVIYDFQGAGEKGGDVILIDPELNGNADFALHHITYQNGNATITLDYFDFGHDNAAITLTGVAPNSLTIDDFQWGFHAL